MFRSKPLVLIATSFIIFIFILFILLNIFKKKNSEKEMYYEIAKKKALSLGFTLKDSQILFDRGNVEWTTTLKDLKVGNPEYAKRFDILNGRNYRTVKFYPKSKYTLGGVLWVFIDAETKEVIIFHGEM